MIELLIANFYPISGAVLLACFVGFINWRNNFKTRQANAAAIFRKIFSDVLIQIQSNEVDPQAFFEERLLVHESAVLEFSKYLGSVERKRFMKAWHDYQYHDGVHFRFSVPYSILGGSIEQKRKNREIAVSRIHDLVSYANQA